MGTANCRDDNMCMFCKYWLGKRPDTNFATGRTNYRKDQGLCQKDSSDSKHDSTGLCHKFQKSLEYL